MQCPFCKIKNKMKMKNDQEHTKMAPNCSSSVIQIFLFWVNLPFNHRSYYSLFFSITQKYT